VGPEKIPTDFIESEHELVFTPKDLAVSYQKRVWETARSSGGPKKSTRPSVDAGDQECVAAPRRRGSPIVEAAIRKRGSADWN
jgi:hypothetical protein